MKASLADQLAEENRAKALALLGGKCSLCGSTDTLCFKHVDRSTHRFYVSTGFTRPWEQLRTEVEKCVLRCRRCNRIKPTSTEWYKVEGRTNAA